MSALTRLSAASRLADRQADLKREEADDINTIYSDYVTYTKIGDGVYGTMDYDNFYRQHGLKFEYTKLNDKGEEITVNKGGMQAEDYDALEPYKNGVMSQNDPTKHKFYFIKNMDDALQLMDSSSSIVSYNDVESGRNERGIPVGVLIDRDTGQIHALNKNKRGGIAPFNIFRNNDPTTPILFTDAEGAYKTFNLALTKNLEAGSKSDILPDIRARLQLEEQRRDSVNFNDVFKQFDDDVDNNLLTPGEALELNNELWTPLQEAIDAKQDEEIYNRITENDTLFDRVDSSIPKAFGSVDKETIIARGDRGSLPTGTSNTSMGQYRQSLSLANEIIGAYENNMPLETNISDVKLLEQGLYPEAYGGDINYEGFTTNGPPPNITTLTSEIADLEQRDPNEVIPGTRSRSMVTGTSLTITGRPTDLEGETTVGQLLAEKRAEKSRAEKDIYDYAQYVKDKIIEDDEALRRVGFTQPKTNLETQIKNIQAQLDNPKVPEQRKVGLRADLENLENDLNTLNRQNPILSGVNVSPAAAQNVNLSPVMNSIDKLTMAESSNNPDALWKQSQNNEFDFKATESTMDQVLEFVKINGEYANWSKGQSDEGKVHTPVGKYQFVGATLRDIKNRGGFDELGITGDTLFTPETQDKLFLWYMNDSIKAAGENASAAEVRDKVRARWEGATPQTITDDELDTVISAVQQGTITPSILSSGGPTFPENTTRVEEIPTLKLPTNEDGSFASTAEIIKYLSDNEDQIRNLLTPATYDKIAAGLIKYNVTADKPDLYNLPHFDPVIGLSLFEAVLGVTAMASDSTTFDNALQQNMNTAFTGHPFLTVEAKHQIQRGDAEFELEFIESTKYERELLEQTFGKYASEKAAEFQEFINGDSAINLYANFDGTSRMQMQSVYNSNQGEASRNYRALLTKISQTGSRQGGPTEVILKNGKYQFSPPLSTTAKRALIYATGDILMSLTLVHGKDEKGGFMGTRIFSGRDRLPPGTVSSLMHTARANVKLDKNGDPYIDKLTFEDPNEVQYINTLPAEEFRRAFPDPQDRRTILALIPEVVGTAGLYVD
mgnify:CR=1 FL=1|tara:strand:- start:7869 stop:11063 length:3195 start_codon:yes stop_codon:yes gene_type:complete